MRGWRQFRCYNTIMDRDTFLEQVRARGDFSGEDVEEAVSAVLGTLGELLTPDEAAALAAQIPEPMAQHLRPGLPARSMSLDEVYAGVARRADLSPARALEVTQIVCGVLAASLAPDVQSRLAAHLGPAVGRLFEAPAGDSATPERSVHMPTAPQPGEGHTLATGRPGSAHPLSEAHPESAHAHSVARSDNPHADTKLSSAQGLTQEALHETLAEGKPGPTRTVAETKD
jgi:uncharacterized protein (DUF2267 family)